MAAARQMVTRKGVRFETTLTDQEAFDVLRREVDDGTAQQFPKSLVLQARTRGLSREQWVWVHKLAMERRAPAPPAPEVVGGLQAVAEMLAKASESLKYPRITYRGLRFTIAGPRSKAPGTVSVTSDARRYAERVFYGRITAGGAFSAADRGCPADVVDTLIDLAQDTVAKVAAEGRRVGSCCFCARELSTRESLHVGYGPVCAEKFGLPWGAVASPEAIAADGGADVEEEDERVGTVSPAKPKDVGVISYGSTPIHKFTF